MDPLGSAGGIYRQIYTVEPADLTRMKIRQIMKLHKKIWPNYDVDRFFPNSSGFWKYPAVQIPANQT